METKVSYSDEYKHVEYDDDVVELNVLGCLVDMLGTNCDQCVSVGRCCFTSTETINSLGRGVQDGYLDFHTVPELSCRI